MSDDFDPGVIDKELDKIFRMKDDIFGIKRRIIKKQNDINGMLSEVKLLECLESIYKMLVKIYWAKDDIFWMQRRITEKEKKRDLELSSVKLLVLREMEPLFNRPDPGTYDTVWAHYMSLVIDGVEFSFKVRELMCDLEEDFPQ